MNVIRQQHCLMIVIGIGFVYVPICNHYIISIMVDEPLSAMNRIMTKLYNRTGHMRHCMKINFECERQTRSWIEAGDVHSLRNSR